MASLVTYFVLVICFLFMLKVFLIHMCKDYPYFCISNYLSTIVIKIKQNPEDLHDFFFFFFPLNASRLLINVTCLCVPLYSEPEMSQNSEVFKKKTVRNTLGTMWKENRPLSMIRNRKNTGAERLHK